VHFESRCSVRFDCPNPIFFLEISSLHHLSTGPVSSPAHVSSLRYESFKISPKRTNFADRTSTKTAISPPKYNIFRKACADVGQTLASIISIVNEPERKTSIEQGRSWLTCNGSYCPHERRAIYELRVSNQLMLQILTYKNYALQNFALYAQNVNDMLHHFFQI
jgi:hypothetical protein